MSSHYACDTANPYDCVDTTIILWAGIGETSKVIVIVIAAVFPIMVNTLSGIASTPGSYVEVAKLYKLSKWKTFVKLYLPHALPQILVGLKLGLGVSWMAVVASELIAAASGIGYRMNEARSKNNIGYRIINK